MNFNVELSLVNVPYTRQFDIFLCWVLHHYVFKYQAHFFTVCKRDFVSVPKITMPSMKVSTLFITSNILRIVLWYISGANDILNGNLWYLYLLSGVINVHIMEHSSSNCSYQNPFEQSYLENIFTPAILAITSSRVSNLKCSWRIALLRFRGTK